jgi:hypothetical protein
LVSLSVFAVLVFMQRSHAARRRKLRSLKPGPKATKIADGGGLHIVVTPNGSKLWRLAELVAIHKANPSRLLPLHLDS